MQNTCVANTNKSELSWLNKTPQQIARKHSSPGTQNIKKYLSHQEDMTPKTQASICKPRSSQQQSKEGKCDKTQKVERSNFGTFFKKDKYAINKKQTYSPKGPTNVNKSAQMSAMRTTLKALVQKSSPQNRSFQGDKTIQQPTAAPKQIKSQNQISKPSNILEKQNQILRQQNQMLKHELSDIKRHLMIQKPSKKEQIISNLRDTIKKEDAAIQELKLKLDISHKKIQSLTKMMESKDQEIDMWMQKVGHLELQLQDIQEKNSERMEVLKEKLNFVVKSFGELEFKFERSELEWMAFKDNWMEEKSMYLHRITFLENYISSN